MLLLSVDLAPSGTSINTGDSFKSKTDVDNKTHTNAHQPPTSLSPIGISISPSPPDLSSIHNGFRRTETCGQSPMVETFSPQARAGASLVRLFSHDALQNAVAFGATMCKYSFVWYTGDSG